MNAQLFFLHSVLLPLLKAAKMGLIEVFFADGVHLTYGYQGGYCWCKERRCVPSAYGRKRANLLGFMNAVTYDTTQVMNDTYLNADSVCEGLEKLRKKYPERILYIILDNAAYQRCKKVKHCAECLNINLIFLPPYSPNLNLIERLWKFLRKKIMANKYYCDFKKFYQTVSLFIDELHTTYFHELRPIVSFQFECFDSPLSD